MARRHGICKISLEMFKETFNIPGDVYLVETDSNTGIVRVHIGGPEAPEVPEGGLAVEMPLDDTIRQRIDSYTKHYEDRKEFFNRDAIKGTLKDGKFTVEK